MFLVLDRLKAPLWIWGAAGIFWVIFYITFIVSVLKEDAIGYICSPDRGMKEDTLTDKR